MDARLFDNTQTLRASVLCGLSFFWALIAFLMALINFWSTQLVELASLELVCAFYSLYIYSLAKRRIHTKTTSLSLFVYINWHNAFRDLYEAFNDGGLYLELLRSHPVLHFYLCSLCLCYLLPVFDHTKQHYLLAVAANWRGHLLVSAPASLLCLYRNLGGCSCLRR
ncbi:GGDEF family protein [Vibrio cholerae]|nr:GGDEF family protein [Vibrio cholerae]